MHYLIMLHPNKGECLKRTPPESQEKGYNVGFTLKKSFEAWDLFRYE